MTRTILQVPINPQLKKAAERKAAQLGFSSLQELIRVMLTQITSRGEVRVDDIAEKYGVTYLGLFGSMARGEATESSDVDLLVKFGENPQLGLFDLDRLQKELEIRFGRRVDLVTKLNKYIQAEAMKDMKTIYER